MASGRVAVLGEWALVRGFALAGVATLAAEDPESVRAAWRDLDGDVAVVILTPAAADALGDSRGTEPLTVVMPS